MLGARGLPGVVSGPALPGYLLVGAGVVGAAVGEAWGALHERFSVTVVELLGCRPVLGE
ncbi:hypothetical protein FRACA_110031 [Frankia canadensis]|uniref:Uncharacterized protein n=1 Tax=Frankia canadensis TaxID=1836972 RepID=A0A2I2KJ87_9ACTN|nr:hypothetical protein FRACA_110031 [Frankia canadensis]SOU53007.1 hypothetical protein FRACA_110031 [Frankia canadensis]